VGNLDKQNLNLVKLCVGIDSVSHLESYRAAMRDKAQADGVDYIPSHVTRMWPRRATEILGGGSIYWVIKGVVQARQTILRFDERIGADGIRRCAIVMDPNIIRTQPAQRRPFQGWRYLEAENAPPDLAARSEVRDELPLELQIALAEIGLR
jgi:hypothetical protein